MDAQFEQEIATPALFSWFQITQFKIEKSKCIVQQWVAMPQVPLENIVIEKCGILLLQQEQVLLVEYNSDNDNVHVDIPMGLKQVTMDHEKQEVAVVKEMIAAQTNLQVLTGIPKLLSKKDFKQEASIVELHNENVEVHNIVFTVQLKQPALQQVPFENGTCKRIILPVKEALQKYPHLNKYFD